MIVDRCTGKITDDRFFNITRYLRSGDVLICNDSKVLPARLIGKKATGGSVELLLIRPRSANTWECMVGNIPIHKQIGATIHISSACTGKIMSRYESTAIVRFNQSGQNLMLTILRHGQIPTPPYIKAHVKESKYQNVFANKKKLGSVAAPTAGLHFTNRLFKKLRRRGIQIEFVTLHVGPGTFLPVKTPTIEQHRMHAEYYELSPAVATRLNRAKSEGRRVIPVGTTALRVLESAAKKRGGTYQVMPATSLTDIFIYPGYQFKYTDALITNFHTPKSTLLMLVSAFAGKDLIDRAYRNAIEKKYRFYSLGDAMLIH